nr:S26 family signal peptidase [Candidatus Levybacteria bacterium]
MEPQIKNGNTVLVSGIIYLFKSPKKGDVIAFKNLDGKILIKRITKKENGKYFMGGDNRKDSLDSNKFGMISKDKILGKVIYTLPAGRQEF